MTGSKRPFSSESHTNAASKRLKPLVEPHLATQETIPGPSTSSATPVTETIVSDDSENTSFIASETDSDASNINGTEAVQSIASSEPVTPKRVILSEGVLADHSPAFRSRLNKFVNYIDVDSCVYSIDRLPKGLDWGVREPFDDNQTLLCDSTNKPFTAWIVGKVSKTWLHSRAGHVSINVAPLVQGSCDAGRRLVALHSSSGNNSIEEGSDIRVARFQTGTGHTDGSKSYFDFADCYDASEVFQQKSLMRAYPARRIKLGDVVLVEANVIRYRNKAGNAVQVDYKSPWSSVSYVARYDLISVSLLWTPPVDVRFCI